MKEDTIGENGALKIRALIISEISGSISKKEQHHLQLLRDNHPEVRALSDYLYEVLESATCDESDEEIKENIKEIIRIGNERIEARKKRKKRWFTWTLYKQSLQAILSVLKGLPEGF